MNKAAVQEGGGANRDKRNVKIEETAGGGGGKEKQEQLPQQRALPSGCAGDRGVRGDHVRMFPQVLA
jgi:hypothetical protein